MSLYRTYRPQTYETVAGQESVVQTFLGAVRSGRIGHAYLLTGPRGTGKTTLARLFTKAINCLDPQDGAPCGRCEICISIEKGTFLDLIEIDAASNRGIDQMRELKERVVYMPNQGKYKVYLIDEVHMLTKEAFNALLKTLEEPPAHVVFLLATTEAHKIPVTILSRCQRLDLRLIEPSKLQAALTDIVQKEGLAISDEHIEQIISLSGGSFRDALSVLDRVQSYAAYGEADISIEYILGLPPRERLREIIVAVGSSNPRQALMVFRDVLLSGIDPVVILRELAELVRRQLLIRTHLIDAAAGEEVIDIEIDMLKRFSHTLLDLIERRSLYVLPQFLFELALVDIFNDPQATAPTPGAPAQSVAPPQTPPAPQPQPSVPPSQSVPAPTAPPNEVVTQETVAVGDGWQAVLTEIKKNAISLYLSFSQAQHSVDAQEKKIIVSLENAFFLRRAQERKNFDIVQEIVSRYFPEHTLELAVQEKSTQPEGDIVDEALKIFDGELID